MKKSRSITLALVGSALLASGCGGSSTARTFYDKSGKPVPRSQWKKADGTPAELFDKDGNPVSPDVVNATYASSSGSTTTHRTYHSTGGWFWGPSFSSGYSSGSRGYSGSSSGRSSSGSVSRGGFGGTGGSHASGGGSSGS